MDFVEIIDLIIFIKGLVEITDLIIFIKIGKPS